MMPLISPEIVSQFVSFHRDHLESWHYDPNDRGISHLQAEGVAAIWNHLSKSGLAVLADEVGMGKTIQAWSIISLLWLLKPKANVLIIAPNQSVAEKWADEFKVYLHSHYRKADNRVKCEIEHQPIHDPIVCTTLESVVNAFSQRTAHLVISKITIFSGLLKSDEKTSKKAKALNAAKEGEQKRLKLLGSIPNGLDLLVVDEAHYLRNVTGDSQRVCAAQAFFGKPDLCENLARNVLLMTATPNHSTNQDVLNILKYFDSTKYESASAALQCHAVRRLRRLEDKNKYQYRLESDLSCDFAKDVPAEIFFALYQKKLAELEDPETKEPFYSRESRNFMHGYLEGFETTKVEASKQVESEADSGVERTDYHTAIDSEILERLSKEYHQQFGCYPKHPKYDQCLEAMVPDFGQFWKRNERAIEEDKNLVFVRRIPSAKELASRANEAYDRLMLHKIMDAIGEHSAWIESLMKSRNFRANLHKEIQNWLNSTEMDSDPIPQMSDGEHLKEQLLTSKVMDYFRKGEGEAPEYSHGFMFRVRFAKPKELFSLFFESPYSATQIALPMPTPSADYVSWSRKVHLDSWLKNGLIDAQTHTTFKGFWTRLSNVDAKVQEGQLETLASIYAKHCSGVALTEFQKFLKKSPCDWEAFFHEYLRKGLLLASGALVELYCWFLRSQKRSRSADSYVYVEFCKLIDQEFNGSLTQRLVEQALKSYEKLSKELFSLHSDTERLKYAWKEMERHSPAAYCTGEVSDRKRLIRSFNTPFFPNIMVATSVLQEGVDLHMHCRRVMHYGISWTPGDNEQRIGRVDRLFGAVHGNIQKRHNDQLLITYPYLSKSLDEDQVGQFIVKKRKAESVLDRGEVLASSKSIDCASSQRNWRQYLLKPNSMNDGISTKDPFPYTPHAADDKKWDRIQQDAHLWKDLRSHVFTLLQDSCQCLDLVVKLHQTRDQYTWLIEPKINIPGRNHQPVEVRLIYHSALSALHSGTVFLLKMRSPLFENEVTGIVEIMSEIQSKYPLIQICRDKSQEDHLYFLHGATSLPLFYSRDELFACSSIEIATCLNQLIFGCDLVERSIRKSQDLSLSELVEMQDSNDISKTYHIEKNPSISPMSLKPSFRSNPLWINNGTHAEIIVADRTQNDLPGSLDLQFQTPFLIPNGSKWVLHYPNIDFQEMEMELLGKWAAVLGRGLSLRSTTAKQETAR